VDAVIGLIGVALGASLAPVLDMLRQHRLRREQRRTELLELVAAFVSVSGDQLLAESSESGQQPWSLEVGFRANAARWRLRLLAPPDVARAVDAYAVASDVLRKRVQVTGGWDGEQISAEWDAWQESGEALIMAARRHLDHL
jgi:hypothetical protein